MTYKKDCPGVLVPEPADNLYCTLENLAEVGKDIVWSLVEIKGELVEDYTREVSNFASHCIGMTRVAYRTGIVTILGISCKTTLRVADTVFDKIPYEKQINDGLDAIEKVITVSDNWLEKLEGRLRTY